MKKLLIVLAFAAVSTFAADSYIVEDPVGGGTGTDDLLQYDDGTAFWVWSEVAYYGTWFDITDFLPGAIDFECSSTEWWYYHHVNNPWDTDQIVVEIWNGDVAGPSTFLKSDDITALHCVPVILNYSPHVVTGTDFWMIANTTVYSAYGVPSVLYDESGNWTGTAHSFYSTSGMSWEPMVMTGSEIDALFRADGCPVSLNSESWGAIKGLFR